jgi:ribonucleoside-diphosphate reductase alpha chain
MSESMYGKLSQERKELQAKGLVPEWMTTAGWQLFKGKYLYDTDEAVYGQYKRIAKAAAVHLEGTPFHEAAEEKFFDLFWKGWLSPSTPVLANMGTNRGLPVACSGGYIEDSIDGFYSARHETASLTKYGFGTSGYLGDVRPRGSNISVGGKASGVVPVFKGFVQDMRDVAQGTARRGAWAGYLPIDHADFDELADFVMAEPDDANVGWIVTQEFIDKLEAQDPDSIRRFQKSLKMKMITGRGYYFKVDTANKLRPAKYKELGLDVKASNLCAEISLHSSGDYTFTCVLSSMNLAEWDEWKDTDAVYWATIFLDCVATEFVRKAEKIPALKKAVEFTKKGRALGLGACGFHTYLQEHKIPFDSLEASFFNNTAFEHISIVATTASEDLCKVFGQTEWADEGMRNSHLTAIAPTKSTALIMGGVSEGINPDPALAYTQLTAGGEMNRVNPILLKLMREKGIYNKKHIQEVVDANGSVQGVGWLTEEEKGYLKTAFEINQETVVRYAAQRQKYVSQSQSLNLFFAADEDAAWISHIHRAAFMNPNIISLYYITTMSGVQASKDCESCQ